MLDKTVLVLNSGDFESLMKKYENCGYKNAKVKRENYPTHYPSIVICVASENNSEKYINYSYIYKENFN